jgi:hypothetical protein
MNILLTETQPAIFEQMLEMMQHEQVHTRPWYMAPSCQCQHQRQCQYCRCEAALLIQRFYRRRLAAAGYLPDYIMKGLKSSDLIFNRISKIVRNAYFINTLNLKDRDKKDLMLQLNNLKDLGDRLFT